MLLFQTAMLPITTCASRTVVNIYLITLLRTTVQENGCRRRSAYNEENVTVNPIPQIQ